jgi:prepilin-type processing-associated H-X9-DG protein
MNVEDYLAQWLAEAPALAGSIVAVLFMVGVAGLLGFRKTARIDEAELRRLAVAEGASLDTLAIAADGRSALALLQGGKLMIARAMGADVSVRIVPAGAARVQRHNGRLSVAFADTGFPPLDLAIEQTPPWLAQLAAGEPP